MMTWPDVEKLIAGLSNADAIGKLRELDTSAYQEMAQIRAFQQRIRVRIGSLEVASGEPPVTVSGKIAKREDNRKNRHAIRARIVAVLIDAEAPRTPLEIADILEDSDYTLVWNTCFKGWKNMPALIHLDFIAVTGGKRRRLIAIKDGYLREHGREAVIRHLHEQPTKAAGLEGHKPRQPSRTSGSPRPEPAGSRESTSARTS